MSFIRFRILWRGSVFLALVSAGYLTIEASNRTEQARSDVLSAYADPDSASVQQQQFSGKLSRRAKAAQKRKLLGTTTIVKTADTTIAGQLDAIRALPRDSSARIAQFMYVRKDKPSVDGFYHKNHSLFLAPPPIVKFQTTLDTSAWVYRLRETVGEDDSRIPTDIPFEEYTDLRLKQTIRQNWESLTQSYMKLSEQKTTLGDIMGKITKIEVPIPKNPIFSIFGPNIIKLNVNGAIDIHAGFRNVKYDLATSNPLGQSQSTPDFKQQIQVNVNGQIGDKLSIAADWNTQRTFEYENQLHIKYTGYEDEVVQSIEAGNVSLPTNSSFISGGSALFGILAKFQLGPLRLTTVATQKKGQIKEITASGGSEAKPIEIRPTGYSTNHYFIDTAYIKYYENIYLNNESSGDLSIRQIEVWVRSMAATQPQTARNVVAFMDQDSVLLYMADSTARRRSFDNPVPGEVEQAYFVKLEPNEFSYNNEAGIISLRTSIQQGQAVAVYYVISNPDGSPKYIGNSGQELVGEKDSIKLVMKLVRPANFTETMKTAWRLQLKNRYPLYVTGIDRNSFEFHIEYQLPGQTATQEVLAENIGLLELFGLDRFSGTGSQLQPDKIFDYSQGITIDEANGEIIFPTVEPFSTASIEKFLRLHSPEVASGDIHALADSLSFNAIYSKTPSVAQNDLKNKYYLRGNVKGSGQASFSIGFNTVEGSVEVTSGGMRLMPNIDYTVDYISCKVVIKNAVYLQPGRDIQIKYEANDMFQLASKSLLGARGEFNLGKNSALGFTIMNYSQQSLSDKVRLGEEPISNMMLGVDGRTSFEAPWLTNLINYIPGIKTTAASQISFGGEAAYILPNPNTRTSPIQSDGGKGVAYIDDFEGAKQTIPLGSSYLQWKDASAPWFSPSLDTYVPPFGIDSGRYVSIVESPEILTNVQKMNYKARACWFNVIPSDVLIPQIWENKDYANGESQVVALNFFFRPTIRGVFNYDPNIDHMASAPRQSWAGIQHALGGISTDLVDQNISFIETWINILSSQDSVAKLNIDLGYISEDVIPNKVLNTEDGLDMPKQTRIMRGTLNPNYDWGLDEMNNEAEKAAYPNLGEDPSGDDWGLLPTDVPIQTLADAERYNRVNGTENNHLSAEGLFPDGEDMNGDKVLYRSNTYFEYEIPLDTNSFEFRKLISGQGKNGWYQIRIPLSEYTRRIGEPTFTSVEAIRVWVTGASQPVLFRLVEFNLVGNQWEKRDKTDKTYDISVVNYEDNPNYEKAPGVEPQKNRANTSEDIFGNEQSLNIVIHNLVDGDAKEAVKNFSQKPLDMFNYRTLKMFVHGERGGGAKGYRAFEYVSPADYDAKFYLRFGDDISNYYEYYAPVQRGWIGNEVIIKFADLTALKSLRDSANAEVERPVAGGPAGAHYRIKGNPRLDQIKFISIGIENPAGIGDSTRTLNGELWANELRLTDVDDTPGWAYKFNTKITFADIGSFAFSLTEQNPFFHQLEVPFGSRNTTRNWNISTSFSFGRLFPDSWSGTMLDVSYQHSESIVKPRYIPGTDILVEKAAEAVRTSGSSSTSQYKDADDVRLKTEDLVITDSYSLPSIKFLIPSTHWLVTETINKMTFSYSYSITHKRDRLTETSESWNWAASFKYGTQFNRNNYVTPFSIFGDFFLLRPWKRFKIYFTPQQMNISASLNRSQSKSKARTATAITAITHSMSARRSFDFGWQFFEEGLLDLGMNYSVNVSSSLDHLEMKNGKLRPFSDILGDIFSGGWLINFGIDQNYNQSISFTNKLKSPKILMLDKIFTPQMRYGVEYSWLNNITLGVLGKSARWSSNPSFSLDVNLKPISEEIWSPQRAAAPSDTTRKTKNPLEYLSDFSRILFKNVFFDFEKVTLSFTQGNTSQNNGVLGGSGFANLFARVPFLQSSLDENGPSLYYQLGLISDPNGRLVLKTKSTFPFFTGYTVPGLRAFEKDKQVRLSNIFSQNNQISMQTSRPLWDGASLDLNWKIGWSYSETRETYTQASDSIPNGTQIFKSRNVSGSLDRSYLSFPSFLMFKWFNTNLEKVNERYTELKKNDKTGKTTDAEKLSQAFEEGLEALPWLSKIFGAFAPRANWSFRWSGLEKISIFKSFATGVSLDHVYSSNYSQRWQLTQQGKKETTSQTVVSGFSPLLRLNVTFKDLGKGKLNATFGYNLNTSYNLSPAMLNVGEDIKSDIAATVTFSRQGFEIPLFGVSLMNNIDISVTFSNAHNSSRRYYFKEFNKDGSPLGGQTTTTIEPRIRYSLSERVTAALYYRYTKLTPDEGGSTMSGTTTNEGGLDISIAIK